jgi:hypothetical protein
LEQQATTLGIELAARAHNTSRIRAVARQVPPAAVLATSAVQARVQTRLTDIDDQTVEMVGIDSVADLAGQTKEGRELLVADGAVIHQS